MPPDSSDFQTQLRHEYAFSGVHWSFWCSGVRWMALLHTYRWWKYVHSVFIGTDIWYQYNKYTWGRAAAFWWYNSHFGHVLGQGLLFYNFMFDIIWGGGGNELHSHFFSFAIVNNSWTTFIVCKLGFESCIDWKITQFLAKLYNLRCSDKFCSPHWKFDRSLSMWIAFLV